jgi:predicted tellurium resistance membrane protein TerC
MIARAIDRYPILNYIGSGVLVVTATRMFFHDDIVHEYFPVTLIQEAVIIVIVVAIVLGIGYWMNVRSRRTALAVAQARVLEGETPLEASIDDDKVRGTTD